MDASEGSIWFLGDLSDPWVVSMADALPNSLEVRRLDVAGDLPEYPFERMRPPRLVVLHRHRLTHQDVERLKDWCAPSGTGSRPVVILCVSPYARYEDLERWAGLVDQVLPEATAADVLPRHLTRVIEGHQTRSSSPIGAGFRIEVAGRDGELCLALIEACRAKGHQVEAVDDSEIGEPPRSGNRPGTSSERILTIWELPVLEPGWAERLENRSKRTGPVIALAGFADRATVASAKARGAIACLDLPCDFEDLLDVIDRKASRFPLDSWPLPIRVEPPHVLPPPPRRRSLQQAASSSGMRPTPWSDRGPLPRIP
jgi:hypothetical protein